MVQLGSRQSKIELGRGRGPAKVGRPVQCFDSWRSVSHGVKDRCFSREWRVVGVVVGTVVFIPLSKSLSLPSQKRGKKARALSSVFTSRTSHSHVSFAAVVGISARRLLTPWVRCLTACGLFLPSFLPPEIQIAGPQVYHQTNWDWFT